MWQQGILWGTENLINKTLWHEEHINKLFKGVFECNSRHPGLKSYYMQSSKQESAK